VFLSVFVVLFALAQCLRKEEEMMVTPFGYMPRGCVHHARENELVSYHDGILKIQTPEGRVRMERKGRCEFGKPVKNLKGSKTLADDPNGWAAYAMWLAAEDFSYFGGVWTVPDVPSQQLIQTLFLFTGFQNSYFLADEKGDAVVTSIIQPVLQWGNSDAGDEKYWAIASWFVAGDSAVYSDLKGPLNPGDIIVGNMTLQSGTKWQIVTEDATLKQSSTLTVDTDVSEVDAFVTLEVYGITDCSEYPNGSDTFTNLILQVGGQPVTPSWTPQTEVGCDESVEINSSTSVTINF